ncbi:MAG: hypothetical protein ACT4N2_13560, partial [Hyphomicrobium sp.]
MAAMHPSFRTVATLVMLSITASANALVGQLDSSNKFPYVVRIFSEFRSGATKPCTGAVSRNSLISTAAHCIFDSVYGPAIKITIHFTDADGKDRRIDHKELFYPKKFETDLRAWEEEQDTEKRSLLFKRMILQDIAFIVPDSFVEVEGYPHWAGELFRELDCMLPGRHTYADQPSPDRCTREEIIGGLEKELGAFASLRTLTVGFGIFECQDYERNLNCRADEKRRFAELPLVDRITVSGETFSAPRIWCTAQNDKKINPLQPGDSGGPR